MMLLLPFFFYPLSMPWPAQRVGVSKSLLEDYCKFRLMPLVLPE